MKFTAFCFYAVFGVFSILAVVKLTPVYVRDLVSVAETFTLADIDVLLTLQNLLEVSAASFLMCGFVAAIIFMCYGIYSLLTEE